MEPENHVYQITFTAKDRYGKQSRSVKVRHEGINEDEATAAFLERIFAERRGLTSIGEVKDLGPVLTFYDFGVPGAYMVMRGGESIGQVQRHPSWSRRSGFLAYEPDNADAARPDGRGATREEAARCLKGAV